MYILVLYGEGGTLQYLFLKTDIAMFNYLK